MEDKTRQEIKEINKDEFPEEIIAPICQIFGITLEDFFGKF